MHGVWKAAAGTDASLREATPSVAVGDREGDALNAQGINVLRTFPAYGAVSWGGRTLASADQQASEWKYIPVRRTALFIEQSLSGGLQWAVFEPNDEPLWAEIRLRVGAFLQQLFRQGAFKGTTTERGVLRQVRPRHDHAGRPCERSSQRRGRLRTAEAGRVRGAVNPAGGWPGAGVSGGFATNRTKGGLTSNGKPAADRETPGTLASR